MIGLKPVRTFNADYGDHSVDQAGPDQIEHDIDILSTMFDPEKVHIDGEDTPGGIGANNLRDGAVTDNAIGDRTIDQEIAEEPQNTGKISFLLSHIGKMIKAITGNVTWHQAPLSNIKTLFETLTSHTSNKNNPHKVEADQINVYTKDELLPFLISGDTEIQYDVFTIVNADNGDGTFSYTVDGDSISGELTEEGYQKFILRNGMYKVGADRIEAWVNDTLHRSVASGGLIEVGLDNTDSYQIILSMPIGNGSEVTFKYYERIGMAGKHAIAHAPGGSDEIITISKSTPAELHPGKILFRIID